MHRFFVARKQQKRQFTGYMAVNQVSFCHKHVRRVLLVSGKMYGLVDIN
jgi:hypothetical protein